MEKNILESSQIQFHLSPGLKRFSFILIVIGLAVILLQILFPWSPGSPVPPENLGSPVPPDSGGADASPSSPPPSSHSINPRLFLSIHLAFLTAVPLALGGIYFTAFTHVSGAVWSVSLRRLAEQSVCYLPAVFIMMLVVFLGSGDIFHHWVHAPADDALIAWKSPWLNISGFIARNIVWILIWFFFGWILRKKSLAQDADGAVSHSRSMARFSAAFLVIFALTYSAHSWDFSLSLEPHWFSTLWAIYLYCGLALTIFAALVLWAWYLKRCNYYGNALTENHLHDLGKFIWGHSIFWAYIAVSQYMLIWYAGIPEETQFFKTRTEEGWIYVSFLLAMLRFVIPFFLLLTREAKRKWNYMALTALLILFGQVWDMYWIAYPTLAGGDFVWLSWQELGGLSLAAGSYIFIMAKCLEKHCLIPKKDPRLEKCLELHQ